MVTGSSPGRLRYQRKHWGAANDGTSLYAITVYCDFSNANVTTMLPLLPPKVNVGCWTRELRIGFQSARTR